MDQYKTGLKLDVIRGDIEQSGARTGYNGAAAILVTTFHG